MTTPIVPKSKALVVINPDAADAYQNARRRRARQGTDALAARGSGIFNRAVIGLCVVTMLVIGIGGWSTSAQLTSAVVAPGQFVVDTHVKRIQHPEGGIIGAILVKNGDRVAAGQLLMRLDDTQVSASRGMIAARLAQLSAERSRLEAERDRSTDMRFGDEPAGADPRTRSARNSEEGLFEARRRLTETQKGRLRQRIDQVRKEMRAIDAQKSAKLREVELIRKELKVVEDMHRRQLSNLTRLIDIQRQLARFEGEHAALESQYVRAESQITEIELQIIEIEQRTTTDAYKDIREVETRIQELTERQLAAEDRLRRTEIRSPVSGVVHDLAVHTTGSVLRAADTAMLIVPDKDVLSIEVRINPSDIDHVGVGQRAVLRLSALNQRTTPQLTGEVVHVGADLTREPHTGRSFYLARISMNQQSAAHLTNVKLVPGMPVESFIETGARTPFSYLVKPITDSLARAMREQ